MDTYFSEWFVTQLLVELYYPLKLHPQFEGNNRVSFSIF